MTRQRKPHAHSAGIDSPGSGGKGGHRKAHPQYYPLEDDDSDGPGKQKGGWFSTALYVTLAGSVVLGVAYFLYLGYLETRINTPLSSPKVVRKTGLQVPDRYWGTYRPGVYFGTRVRHPTSPVTGLMWFMPGHFQHNMLAVRHWCDQADDLPSYGWQKHDGRHFGSQRVVDQHLSLTTDFVKRPGGKHGGDWTARITAQPRSASQKGQLASLLYYVALDPADTKGSLQPLLGSSQGPGALMGTAEAVGGFRLHVLNTSGIIRHTHHLSMKHMGLDLLKESVFKGLRLFQSSDNKQRDIGLMGDLYAADDMQREPTFVVFQLTGELPFQIEVVYESDSFTQRPNMFTGETFTRELEKYSDKFDFNFNEKFPLQEKGYGKDEIDFAKAALSNMIGGIGYFYGASKVQGEPNREPVPYWKAPLYSAVPSRSFFPRGFLWDEGFHNLLISKWDREISLDILAHWMDLMNWDGWIPREQILGVEARARVPDEFVIQRSKNANPPTLLLTLHSMMTGFKEQVTDEDYEYLKLLWPRIRSWYNWFNDTQSGQLPGSYRWRGRDANKRELNPKTLTSGLDDYPRASHPSVDERHLDLRCWMTLAAGLMADIARMIEKDPTRYEESYRYLSNNAVLDSLHWSYNEGGYMDYGLHTFDVELKKLNPNSEMVRVTHSDPKLRYVDSSGYVSFFPLFLQILDPQSDKLGKVLEDLRRPDLLWTEYGLRSLAKRSPLYMKRNTEHDPPYWRGPIWLNMNYLCVRALHHYAHTVPGPHAALAGEIYQQLRKNLISNLVKEYKRTGYLWEQYSDSTGRGQGCRPFTGWSALIVLTMAESY